MQCTVSALCANRLGNDQRAVFPRYGLGGMAKKQASSIQFVPGPHKPLQPKEPSCHLVGIPTLCVPQWADWFFSVWDV
jgi:hypothetical protein